MLQKGDTLVIASHNRDKIREIRDILAPLDLKLTSAADLNLAEPEETGKTFYDNAYIKATEIGTACQLPCVADDSGLCVSTLKGAPGIYSARWAQREDGTRDYEYAFQKIFETLDPTQSYEAMLTCTLVLAFPNGETHPFVGIIKGHVSLPARGDHKFGYDPIFTPEGYTQTFGEMDPVLKSTFSHRRLAFEDLLKFCQGKP
jgi:XTP/dITP diphosphohydrolase